jgi:hypothetical protein
MDKAASFNVTCITDLLDQVLLLFSPCKYEFIDLRCMHTLFSGSLCRICLKQYNSDFSSSADDIAGFRMIHIIDLFNRFLVLFYEVTRQSWEHVCSLIRASHYWTYAKYYSFDFDSSVDSASFQMIYDINRMEECFHCFPA